MLVTWKYRPRNTLVQRFGPRARLVFSACVVLAVIQFWDLRVLGAFLALALGQFLAAGIGFRETRRFWGFLLALLFFLSLITLLTGRGGEGLSVGHHVLARLPALRAGRFLWQLII